MLEYWINPYEIAIGGGQKYVNIGTFERSSQKVVANIPWACIVNCAHKVLCALCVTIL